MSGTYVKVFGSILNSSVWCADVETKVVWITLLLLADGEGCVWGAVPGIARQAGVDVDACRRAIQFLSDPDPDSRTPDEQGRRIIAIEGGWRIVTARKYREMQTNGQRLASARARRYRERKAAGESVTQRDERYASRVSRTEEEEESEEEGEERQRTYDAAPPVAGRRARKPRSKATSNVNGALTVTATANGWPAQWVGVLVDRWRPHGEVTAGQLGKLLKPLQGRHAFEDVERGLCAFLDAGKASFGPQAFARAAGDWIAGRAGTERKQTIGDRMVSETSEFLKTTEGGS